MKKTIIIIIIALLIIGIYSKKDEINIFGEKIKEFEIVKSYPKLESSKFGIFKDNICHWQGDRVEISKIDGQDEPLSLGINISEPLIEYGNHYIYFANPIEGQIYFVNEKAELIERIETGRQIFSIREIGDYFIYHGKEETGESIGIINKKGQKVMNYEFPNQNILDYNLDKSGEILMVSKIEIEDGNIKSCIEKYESGDKKDNIYFQDEVIVQIHLIDEDDMVLLSESNVYRMTDKEIKWKKEYNLIKDIEFQGNNIYLLYSNYLEILDLDGKSKSKLDFNEDYTNIQIKKSSIIGSDIVLSSSSRITVIQGNNDIVTKKQIVEQVDFNDDYYFILDNEKYSQFDIIKRVLKTKKEEEI